jgi:hypothetical protein
MPKISWKKFGISALIGLGATFICLMVLAVLNIKVEDTNFCYFTLPAWSFLIFSSGSEIVLSCFGL